MTQNQISYFKAKEEQRHNMEMEKENFRHNVASEGISQQTNTINDTHLTRMDEETRRHNLVTEDQTRETLGLKRAELDLGNRTLQETTRHNMASESLNLQTLQETSRHNIASEAISAQTLDESHRHNVANEMISYDINNETQRHNIATENETSRVNGSIILSNYSTVDLNNQRRIESQQKVEESKSEQAYNEAKTKTENIYRFPGTVSAYASSITGMQNTLIGPANTLMKVFGAFGTLAQ